MAESYRPSGLRRRARRSGPAQVLLCGAVRTPLGRVGGKLAPLSAEELLRAALEPLLDRATVQPAEVESLAMGCLYPPPWLPSPARVAALRAGLAPSAAAATVQAGCASGLEAFAYAARQVHGCEAGVAVAGGADSSSQACFCLRGPRSLRELRSLQTVKRAWATFPNEERVTLVDGLEQAFHDPVDRLGLDAAAEVCAQQHRLTRQAQDEVVLESRRRASAAWAARTLAGHVVPAGTGGDALEADERAGQGADPAQAALLFDQPRSTIEGFYRAHGRHLDGRPFVFGRSAATVTAAHLAAPADGGAAALLASAAKAREMDLDGLARVAAWAWSGEKPSRTGWAAAEAVARVLERAGWRFDDVSRFELHEPFAAAPLAVFAVGRERWGHAWRQRYDGGRVNPDGGTLGYGHAPGATGLRLVAALAHAIQAGKARRGVAAASGSGGGAWAVALEAP